MKKWMREEDRRLGEEDSERSRENVSVRFCVYACISQCGYMSVYVGI